MKSSARLAFLFLFCTLTSLLIPDEADARWKFEEGDWIAWGDSRLVSDIETGRSMVYFATSSGVLRWDRNLKSWLYPWFTVPGPFHGALSLQSATKVREDPLTEDLYVQTPSGWVVKSFGNPRWNLRDEIPDDVLARMSENHIDSVKPPYGLIWPHGYFLLDENVLEYRFLKWKFHRGKPDNLEYQYFSWAGFGVGIANTHTSSIDLYPGGPGPAKGLDFDEDGIWAVNRLQPNEGWLWYRPRSESAWQFFDPGLEWGLENGNVNRLRVGENGSVWIATDNGLMFRNGKVWRHLRKQDGLPQNYVRDVAPFDDHAWIATHYGLGRVGLDGSIRRPDHNNGANVFGGSFDRIVADEDGLYAAGIGVLARSDAQGIWTEIEGPMMVGAATRPTALYSKNGILAIGDRTGFAWKQDGDDWNTVAGSLWREGDVLAIEYFGGLFWLGTSDGLVKYNPLTGKIVKYKAEDGLAGKIVYEIIPEGDWVWLGTDRAVVRFKWNVPSRIE